MRRQTEGVEGKVSGSCGAKQPCPHRVTGPGPALVQGTGLELTRATATDFCLGWCPAGSQGQAVAHTRQDVSGNALAPL